MAKDQSAKKEKKEKKEKLSDDNGVKKVKKEKKDKKEKKEKREEQLAAALDSAEKGDSDAPVAVSKKNPKKEEMDVDEEETLRVIPKEALVPFANPLADEKQTKKVLKSVRKASKHKAIKRGVKEVVKCVRKSPTDAPSSSKVADPVGIVVLAADISPMDVISHIPVLCEDHNIPYIYITSRAELGAAGNTKRPTSVVLVSRDRGTKVKSEGDDSDYAETYKDLLKLVLKAGGSVKI